MNIHCTTSFPLLTPVKTAGSLHADESNDSVAHTPMTTGGPKAAIEYHDNLFADHEVQKKTQFDMEWPALGEVTVAAGRGTSRPTRKVMLAPPTVPKAIQGISNPSLDTTSSASSGPASQTLPLTASTPASDSEAWRRDDPVKAKAGKIRAHGVKQETDGVKEIVECIPNPENGEEEIQEEGKEKEGNHEHDHADFHLSASPTSSPDLNAHPSTFRTERAASSGSSNEHENYECSSNYSSRSSSKSTDLISVAMPFTKAADMEKETRAIRLSTTTLQQTNLTAAPMLAFVVTEAVTKIVGRPIGGKEEEEGKDEDHQVVREEEEEQDQQLQEAEIVTGKIERQASWEKSSSPNIISRMCQTKKEKILPNIDCADIISTEHSALLTKEEGPRRWMGEWGSLLPEAIEANNFLEEGRNWRLMEKEEEFMRRMLDRAEVEDEIRELRLLVEAGKQQQQKQQQQKQQLQKQQQIPSSEFPPLAAGFLPPSQPRHHNFCYQHSPHPRYHHHQQLHSSPSSQPTTLSTSMSSSPISYYAQQQRSLHTQQQQQSRPPPPYAIDVQGETAPNPSITTDVNLPFPATAAAYRWFLERGSSENVIICLRSELCQLRQQAKQAQQERKPEQERQEQALYVAGPITEQVKVGSHPKNHHQPPMLQRDIILLRNIDDNTFSFSPELEKKYLLTAWWEERRRWEKERSDWKQEDQAQTLRYRLLKASTYKHNIDRAAMAKEMQDHLRVTLDTYVSDGFMSEEYASLQLKYSQDLAAWTIQRQNLQREADERTCEVKVLRRTVIDLQKAISEAASAKKEKKDARLAEAVELLQIDNESLELQIEVLTKKKDAYQEEAARVRHEILPMHQGFMT